jgi:hypothetical protein
MRPFIRIAGVRVVEAKVGGQFDCHFTGPEGKPNVANMRITKVDGERVEFDVNTHPS